MNGSNALGRSFLDIENGDDDSATGKKAVEQPTGMAMNVLGKKGGAVKDGHLSNEEEIERHRGVLMRRLRMLRAACEDLEKQVDQARHASQKSKDAQDKAQKNVDATMYSGQRCMLTADNYFSNRTIHHFLNSH